MRTTSLLRIPRHQTFAALLVLSALAPVPALAQQPLTPVRVHGEAATRNNARADTLEIHAVALYGVPREWRTVATLHRRAAELRGDDPRAAESFRLAAWAYSAARDLGMARQMMLRAAERAAGSGDIEKAAHSYIDAAFIAIDEERDDRLPDLLRKVRVLLDAPLLPAERRVTILQRVEGAPRLAQAWRAP
jgi:hypothetical protein